MKRDWELKKQLPIQENQNVINEYLLSLINEKKSIETVKSYRIILQSFFREKKVSYLSITTEDIEHWVKEQKLNIHVTTIQIRLSVLASFFSYCVQKGFIEKEKSPILSEKMKRVNSQYGDNITSPFVNKENENVINQFLGHLKAQDRPKTGIKSHRVLLQLFFKHRESSYLSVTWEEIEQWLSNHASWSTETVRNYLYYLRSFYSFCIEKGYIDMSPVKNKKHGEGIPERYWVIKKTLPNEENLNLLNDYLTSLKLANYSKHTINNSRIFLQKFFKDINEPFFSFSSDTIKEWLHTKIGVKEKTLYYQLSVLHSFCRFCVEEGVLEKNIIKSRWFPRLPKPMPKFLEKKEVAKIRTQSEKGLLRDRVMLEFFLSSGCRVGEVRMLDRTNVDVQNGTAVVIGKGSKVRQVHFSVKCSLLLEQYLESRIDKSPALFVSTRAKPRRLSTQWLRTIMHRMGKESGITKSIYPHKFRHTFATELLTKGADLMFISDELGHSHLQTTLIYANLPDREIISLYRKYMG